jgi:hypothetical protein
MRFGSEEAKNDFGRGQPDWTGAALPFRVCSVYRDALYKRERGEEK